MGPALDDIDKLLTMPSGCGEQNMLKFAPNIFVMQYLESVNEVTETIKKTSTNFLQTGAVNRLFRGGHLILIEYELHIQFGIGLALEIESDRH